MSGTGQSRDGVAVGGVVVTIGGFLVLGVLVGWLWSLLADPASYTVTRQGVMLGETEAAKQFGVAVTFTWLGALAAVLWGGLCTWRLAGNGWVQVVVTVVGAMAAAVVAWQLGLALGPPDPGPIVRSAGVGTHVPMQVDIHGYGVLFVWPLAAVLALIAVVTWLVPPESAERDPDDT